MLISDLVFFSIFPSYLSLCSFAFCVAMNAASARMSFLAPFFSRFILWSNLDISNLSLEPVRFFTKGSKLKKKENNFGRRRLMYFPLHDRGKRGGEEQLSSAPW